MRRHPLALRRAAGAGAHLLGDILARRKLARAIAINADQEPVQSENKHWLRFLNRDSAFYTGPEEIARATRYPVWFLKIRRVSRGVYAAEAVPVWDAVEKLAARRADRTLRRHGRSSRSARRQPTGRGRTSAGACSAIFTADGCFAQRVGHSARRPMRQACGAAVVSALARSRFATHPRTCAFACCQACAASFVDRCADSSRIVG